MAPGMAPASAAFSGRGHGTWHGTFEACQLADICPKNDVYFGQMVTARGPALDMTSRILDRVRRATIARSGRPSTSWTSVPGRPSTRRSSDSSHAQAIARLDRGLYHLPRVNALTGRPDVPDHNAVIDAVARRDQSRVVVDGLTAANDLGLTTAVPARITVLTDARLRPIQLGNQQIRFQAAAPSRLYWAGHPAMRIVQALHWSQDVLESDRANDRPRLRAILNDKRHGPSLGTT